ncbi:MAG: GxxExxY protein, partial [Bacteroidetes bacterium]|nr:GxxExxY protein [Bacteroidota bacterium]
YTREKEYPVYYNNTKLKHTFFADFVVFDKVILEVKAVSEISDAHKAQSMNYLKISKSRVALLVNFGQQRLEYYRFII